MTERAYTVSEIDRMRAAVKELAGDWNGNWRTIPRSEVVEDRLRTYMLAGISPEALEQESQERDTKRWALMDAYSERIEAERDLEARERYRANMKLAGREIVDKT